ncbi:MAG: ECF transporter S component [Erysipelotrichaceae bacterium]
MNSRTKKMTLVAMSIALAFGVMLIGRVPVVMFLKYDPKDIVIAITGFILGPFSAVITSVVVSTLELGFSETGIIGAIMNILSTVAFVLPASIMYKNNKTLKSAIIGLALGALFSTAMMMLWNYFLTPIYLGVPRSEVVKILVPVILPFNLVKTGINMSLTLLLYKRVVNALTRMNLIENSQVIKKDNTFMVILSLIILVSSILYFLVLRGVI